MVSDREFNHCVHLTCDYDVLAHLYIIIGNPTRFTVLVSGPAIVALGYQNCSVGVSGNPRTIATACYKIALIYCKFRGVDIETTALYWSEVR